MIAQLSSPIESKSVFVSERGLTSVQWTEYSEHTKRVQYSTVPTSSITSEVVMVDGFALSQKDTAGVATTFTRSYTVNGMVLTQTDGRGNNGECDHMGRRAIKRVMVNGNVTLHQRYIYRGYLQIACIDLTRSHHPALWYITWDPTQPIATRPLAIQKDGTWYTYGWDLTKNICEVYSSSGYIRTSYTYAPYSDVSSTGNVEQPNQWSSEFNDTELGLIYYNYRHYNPVDGRWIGRDEISGSNLYSYTSIPITNFDSLGLENIDIRIVGYETENIVYVSQSDANRYKNTPDILGKIDHGDGSVFATTHGVIEPSGFVVDCNCKNRRDVTVSIDIKASILILINKKKKTNIFHGAPAGLQGVKNIEFEYIPSNDQKYGSNPAGTLAAEMDHFRDLHAWFSGTGIRNSMKKNVEEILSNKSIRESRKRCASRISVELKQLLRDEYKKVASESYKKYDAGPNPPHVIDGDYPNISIFYTTLTGPFK